MSITFKVIDQTCEAADQSFFKPQIRMSTKSTTKYSTVYGYDEFIISSPPKKYKTITWNGVSERIAYTMEETPRQCGGARYAWTGAGKYNSQGQLIQSYSKKFFAQCSKQYWPLLPLQDNSFATNPDRHPFPAYFVGYCWPDDPQSCPTCDPNIVNWPLIGDQTTNNVSVDLAGFLINTPVVTSTSWSASGQVFGFFSLVGPGGGTPSGHHYSVTVGSAVYDAESVFLAPNPMFPVELVTGVEGSYVNFVDASNYSAVLSDEYTDAEALSNAQTIVGTGATASNQPRTTGFTSITTTVEITLICTNLVVGNGYEATVDLWNVSEAIFEQPAVDDHLTSRYEFIADDTTHTIVDTIPIPDPFSTVTVSKPAIVFVE